MNKAVLYLWCLILLCFAEIPFTSASQKSCESTEISKLKVKKSSKIRLKQNYLASSTTKSKPIDLKTLRANLNEKIKKLVKIHHEIPENEKFKLIDYQVENWPKFVSFHYISWDEESIREIQDRLPYLKFTKKLESSESFNKEILNSEYREIKALLRGKIKSLTKNSVKKIRWSKYHITGWPVGVSDIFRNARNYSKNEMREIFLGIDNINFIPVLEGQQRTITYVGDNCNETKHVSSGSDDINATTIMELEFEVELSPNEEILIAAGILTSLSAHENSEIRTSSELESGTNLNEINSNLTGSKTLFELANLIGSQNLFDLSLEVYRRIKTRVMDQLNFSDRLSFKFILTDYKISNWPDFVSFDLCDWDEKSMIDILAAIPYLEFTKITTDEKQTYSYFSKYRKSEMPKIMALLYKKFIDQTKLTSLTSIPWSEIHLKGWPLGISDYSSSRCFTLSEMLAISRGISRITFVPIQGEEKPTITYIDGSCFFSNRKNINRNKIGQIGFKSKADSDILDASRLESNLMN